MKTVHRLIALALLLVSGAISGAAHAQTIKVTRQSGVIYLSTYVMEQRKLIEGRAAALGVPGLTVEWVAFSGGGNATDAMLAGSIDVINSGTGNMLLLWDRTRGGVKGIVATSALPLVLVSRDPRIKTLRDLAEGDKVAVPTVRVSTQAVLLQIAAAKEFGPANWNRYDGFTVQMGHPDAAVALMNPRHEVANHFSAPPFIFQTLKAVPGAHVVTDTQTIMGSPLTNGMFFATTKFGDANPKLIQAIKEASLEAEAFIRTNPREAIEMYRRGSNDRQSTDDLLAMMKEPGMDDYSSKPQGTMVFAEHMHRIGTLKTKPASWKDYFFSIAHDLDGN